MTDSAIQNARAQRDEYLERIKKLEQSIARTKGQLIEINKFISLWEKFNAKAIDQHGQVEEAVQGANVRIRPRPRPNSSSPASNNPKKEEINEIVESLLLSDREPVSRSDLYKRLVANGTAIHGARPEMILSTMLWRMQGKSNVVRSAAGGYILKQNLPADVEIDHSIPLENEDD